MPPALTRLWIPAAAVGELLTEAQHLRPAESGGVLLGYWAHESTEAVITGVIGPGPDAEHRTDGFRPDAEYHQAAVGDAYARSGRRVIYLGDWHSHPASRAVPSKKDRGVLRRIASDPGARLAQPLMLIVGVDHERFEVAGWQGRITRSGRLWVRAVELRPFADPGTP